MKENIFIKLLSAIKTLSTKKQKSYLVTNIILFLFSGIIDLVGLAIIIATIYILKDDNMIQSNNVLKFIFYKLKNLSLISNEKEFQHLILISLIFSFVIKNILVIGISYLKHKFIFNLSIDLTLKNFQMF